MAHSSGPEPTDLPQLTGLPQPSAGAMARRSLVKGVAWSVPGFALGVAAPVMASSCAGGSWDSTVVADAPDGAGNEYTLAIPAWAKNVMYTVVGGNAGSWEITTGDPSGRGAMITGTLTGVAGTTLTLIPGGGGAVDSGVFPPDWPTAQGKGGVGYGNGGDGGVLTSDGSYSRGGGAGSAILAADRTPLVVAGGGGTLGAGQSWNSMDSGGYGWWYGADTTTPADGVPFGSGDAVSGTPSNGAGRVESYVSSTGTRYVNPYLSGPGRGAVGATGGAAGEGIAYTNPANGTLFTVADDLPGNAGGGHGTGHWGGGDGGDGVVLPWTAGPVEENGPYEMSSGGGGGGYAGGGSGGVHWAYATDEGETRNRIQGQGGGGGIVLRRHDEGRRCRGGSHDRRLLRRGRVRRHYLDLLGRGLSDSGRRGVQGVQIAERHVRPLGRRHSLVGVRDAVVLLGADR